MSAVKNEHSFRLLLASGFYLGLAPFAPGSFGALVGLGWHCLALALGWGEGAVRLWCLVGAVVFSLIHYRLTPWAVARWRDPDPRHFVLADSALPVWAWALVGFATFRVLDAIKLPLARYIDRNIHTASGVLFDDVVSAVYTAALVSGVAWMTGGA